MAGYGLPKKSRELIERNVRPVVEFFPVDFDEKSDKSFLDLSRENTKQLRSHLASSKGIYAFYNSEYEIIYVGKTKSNLWNEMKFAFNRTMSHYKKFHVNHPHGQYKPTSGSVRAIQKFNLHVYDCAAFFSAYAIEDDALIDFLELMFIRMCPNDILNVRMEGNKTLAPFWTSD